MLYTGAEWPEVIFDLRAAICELPMGLLFEFLPQEEHIRDQHGQRRRPQK